MCMHDNTHLSSLANEDNNEVLLLCMCVCHVNACSESCVYTCTNVQCL